VRKAEDAATVKDRVAAAFAIGEAADASDGGEAAMSRSLVVGRIGTV
jgi:hypothetical protein